ncbi:MAG: glycoside hydrolase family 3 C-terminal domain-containing protein [Bacteroidales bacterium]|nr:glycoside hydrolase family 3 C-terminal domain-containing protein [Bacteroidales bacterium]
MKLTRFTPMAALVALVSCAQPTLQDRLLANDKAIDEVIAKMSLEEKVMMFHSKTNMSSEGVPSQGILAIQYADGPFGIREEGVPNGFAPAGWVTDSATYFPTGSALAATWSKELAYKYGTGMGTEARVRGKDVILGPAINIQRLPVGGRSYEYLSEDPFLSAQLATGYVLGVQEMGTAACIKHFALNNQETNRGSVNVIVDERTMREIYLKPFEAAIVDGGAMVVMPAYNKVNGDYCSENEHLNNEILRGEWGFKGFTVSDWGGTHSTMGAAMHGLNVQMTGDRYLGPALIDSVNAGKVPMEVIDQKAKEILRVRYAIKGIPDGEHDLPGTIASQPESRRIAYEVAQKSIVLLKNDGILPIRKDVKKIAVIGRNAVALTQSGGMGAGVKAPYEVTPLQGIQNKAPKGTEVVYAAAYKDFKGMFGRRRPGDAPDPTVAVDINEAPTAEMLAEALVVARDADLVIYLCGTNKSIETEGSDRKDIDLPLGQNEILAELAQVNSNIVTVVISGGPCDLQQVVEYSPAVVQGWWNGLEGGNALGDVLFGNIAPSGKLPFTFPVKLQDSPAYALNNFPQKEEVAGDLFGNQYRQDVQGQAGYRQRMDPNAYYSEGMYVGYRWFDSKNVKSLYAFGHGLSYVTFKYANIKANKSKYGKNDVIKVSFDLTNEGSMEADEVAQLYVHRIDSNVEFPYKELKAFERVTLAAGETKTVTLEIPVKDLRYWNEAIGGWDLDSCNIELQLGSASDDIRLKTQVAI